MWHVNLHLKYSKSRSEEVTGTLRHPITTVDQTDDPVEAWLAQWE